ncbi:hypothetical protein M422DRAFT_263387 [Sphaerobolus stellatus SS14]|uniref:Uncharacterized protein n=1 Tax=Sphaerobolus stellatus (strain SS14) TaxID=990650 RepID=A0A0C9VAF2_SPHS4|nr:hypothetical protein M422DRAFT_263387 [Sphaerobolus stellatus SS14]
MRPSELQTHCAHALLCIWKGQPESIDRKNKTARLDGERVLLAKTTSLELRRRFEIFCSNTDSFAEYDEDEHRVTRKKAATRRLPIAAPAIRSVSARKQRVTTDAMNDGPITRVRRTIWLGLNAITSWAVKHANSCWTFDCHSSGINYYQRGFEFKLSSPVQTTITTNVRMTSHSCISPPNPFVIHSASSRKFTTVRINSTTTAPPYASSIQDDATRGGPSRSEAEANVQAANEVAAKELHKRRRPLSSFTTAQDELPQVDEVANGGDEGDDDGSEQDGMDDEEVVEENEATIVSGVDVAVVSNAARDPSINLEDDSLRPWHLTSTANGGYPSNWKTTRNIKAEEEEDSIKPEDDEDAMPQYEVPEQDAMDIDLDADSGVYHSPEPVSDSEHEPDFAYPDIEDSEAYGPASIISAVSSAHISPRTLRILCAVRSLHVEVEAEVSIDWGDSPHFSPSPSPSHSSARLSVSPHPSTPTPTPTPSPLPSNPAPAPSNPNPNPASNHAERALESDLADHADYADYVDATMLRVRVGIIRVIDAGALRTGEGESEGGNQNRNQRSARTQEVKDMGTLVRILQRKVEGMDTGGGVAGRISQESKGKLEETLMILELGALSEVWDGKLEESVLERRRDCGLF